MDAARVPIHKSKKRITDAEMETAFNPDSWLTCTGPAGTMILADTVGFHRGGRPVKGRRILLTFTYTSGIAFSPRRLNVSGKPKDVTQDSMKSYALWPLDESENIEDWLIIVVFGVLRRIIFDYCATFNTFQIPPFICAQNCDTRWQ